SGREPVSPSYRGTATFQGYDWFQGDSLPRLPHVDDLVDAALVGFDRREPVTIPPLPDAGQWDALQAARQAMLPNYRNEHPAERYRTVA
ncbi:hypothetical protein NKH23_22215, partial [Mesorhizobium sp. M1328]